MFVFLSRRSIPQYWKVPFSKSVVSLSKLYHSIESVFVHFVIVVSEGWLILEFRHASTEKSFEATLAIFVKSYFYWRSNQVGWKNAPKFKLQTKRYILSDFKSRLYRKLFCPFKFKTWGQLFDPFQKILTKLGDLTDPTFNILEAKLLWSS